jgi:hypothetical protein
MMMRQMRSVLSTPDRYPNSPSTTSKPASASAIPQMQIRDTGAQRSRFGRSGEPSDAQRSVAAAVLAAGYAPWLALPAGWRMPTMGRGHRSSKFVVLVGIIISSPI